MPPRWLRTDLGDPAVPALGVALAACQVERPFGGCHAAAWKGLMQFRCKLISVASWSGKGDPDMMKTLGTWSPAPYLDVTAVDREESRWLVTISGQERACCPVCGVQSSSRHSVYSRMLGDLSAQGTPVTIRVRVSRCRNCGVRRQRDHLCSASKFPVISRGQGRSLPLTAVQSRRCANNHIVMCALLGGVLGPMLFGIIPRQRK